MPAYGLAANLLAMPVMSAWVMPFAVIGLIAAPLGLDTVLYQAMALGSSWILAVARHVAETPGAVWAIPAGGAWTATFMALGGLWLALWRTPALRLMGAAPVVLALALWADADRPDVLIRPGGRLVGVMTAEGRARDLKPSRRSPPFAASLWLRRDGDPATAEAAARRRAFVFTRNGWVARVTTGDADWRIERI